MDRLHQSVERALREHDDWRCIATRDQDRLVMRRCLIHIMGEASTKIGFADVEHAVEIFAERILVNLCC